MTDLFGCHSGRRSAFGHLFSVEFFLLRSVLDVFGVNAARPGGEVGELGELKIGEVLLILEIYYFSNFF